MLMLVFGIKELQEYIGRRRTGRRRACDTLATNRFDN